jgi:hypothetical protein
LDADTAANVLIKAKLINSYVFTEKPFGWMDMSSLGSTDVWAYMQHHSCDLSATLRLWRICVLFCGCLSAYFVCEDRTLISFFKSGNTSDNSLKHFLAGWSKRWVHICAFFMHIFTNIS